MIREVRFRPTCERFIRCVQPTNVLSSTGLPVGMHATDGHCAARSCLRHQTRRVGFPCRVLLQRRIALASADARRHSIGDAVLSPGNPRLDRPAWRAHAAAHHDARPGSGGALPALSLTCPRPRTANLFPLGLSVAAPAAWRWCLVAREQLGKGVANNVEGLPAPCRSVSGRRLCYNRCSVLREAR